MLGPDLRGTLELRAGARVELVVADGSLARALFEGVPVARILSRARLASDERDASSSPSGRAGSSTSSWDALMQRLLGNSVEAKQRVKRAVARHQRVAVDEGALHATDATLAPLVFAVASTTDDGDASLAEMFPPHAARSGACDAMVAQACAVFDPRLRTENADLRTPMFEACVRLAARVAIGPFAWERLRAAAEKLSGPELALTLLRPATGSLFPRNFEDHGDKSDRHMALLDRVELDALVAQDPRQLASKIARLDADAAAATRAKGARDQLDTLVADLAWLLSHEGALVLAIVPFEPSPDDAIPAGTASMPSWTPHDWTSPDAASRLADALEKGATTIPRVRAVVLGGGEPALDSVGAEMLHAALHPFASAAFAEILARSSRPRDVIRLVTYFAIAPDPALAARALSTCSAPELPRVLSAWLESMLPTGASDRDDEPEPESAARVTACIASLSPYPHLHRAVRPLLARVSDAPPASA